MADFGLIARAEAEPQHDVGESRYLGSVIRVLSLVPRWLVVTLALVAAAGLFVIAQVSASLHGWQLALKLALGVLFAATAVGLPQLDHWRAQQETRLKVRLEADPPELAVPSYVDDERTIESLVKAEEADCLASLPRPRPARRRGFDAGAVAEELDEAEERAGTGNALTPEQQRIISVARQATAAAGPAIKAMSSFSILGTRPDKRTADEYRHEVTQHLSDYRVFLDEHLLWRYVTEKIGRFSLTLVNPTDQVFEGVQVEVYLPGQVRALDPDEVSWPGDTKPATPRPFGKSTPIGPVSGHSIFGEYTLRVPGISAPNSGLNIDNSASARITYPPVRLRPVARITLQEIILEVTEPPGSVISGIWEATAVNAAGRVGGNVTLKVTTTPLPVREMLADWSEPETR